jgi:hypothetical protein
MDPLAPVIKPELLEVLLKLAKDPQALFGPSGCSSRSRALSWSGCSKQR